MKLVKSDVWEEMVVKESGLLSPCSATESVSLLEIDEDQPTSETETLAEAFSQNETQTETKNHKEQASAAAKLRTEKIKKVKRDEPLEKLIGTCTSIGQNISNLFSQEKVDSSDEDYQFLMSLLPSLKKIKNKKNKLQLKAKIILEIADVVDEAEGEKVDD